MLKLPSLTEIRQERQRRSTSDAVKNDREAVLRRCKSLAGFVREAWHIVEPSTSTYVHGWHIDCICAHLEAITYGRFLALGFDNRLLINIPPGMMKSLLVSVLWPAWEWGPAGFPGMRYFSTAYSDVYAIRDSRKMRDLVASEWYQSLWGDKVQLVRKGEDDFSNTSLGNRKAMAFTSLTSGRGDRVILDDPHSTEQAESEADRKKAIRIFRESLPSRTNDAQTSAIVIIMQRLNEQDVSGVAIAMGLGYIHLMLPMEFEPERQCVTPIFKDPRTYDSELLFPERFPRPSVDKLKIPLGTYGTAGQLQQRPAPRGGLMFKRTWFEVVEAAPAGWRKCRGWDLAASTEDGSPFTAGVCLSTDGKGRFCIEHVARERGTGNAVKVLIKNTATQDGRGVVISLPQDPGQAGKVQVQDMIGMLAGYRAYGSPESGDKITRAQPVAAQAEAGNITVVKGPWNDDFFGELETFPTAKFKDQVDALSRAFGHLTMRKGVSMVLPIIVTAGRTHFGDHPELPGGS